MKKESKMLLDKALDSLMLSINSFNSPFDRGRVSSVLILLDHSFEMIMKAAILHKGGKIREKGKKETIGFDNCVRKGLSDSVLKFVTNEQAMVLQTINGLRDAAQHHLLEISESQLYIHVQSGLTLFSDLLLRVFGINISSVLPNRTLPVSTEMPLDLEMMFDYEIAKIKEMMKPGKRKQTEAEARLRPLAILDSVIKGEKGQPTKRQLNDIKNEITSGKTWQKIFVGAASIRISTEGSGPSISLRISSKEGEPIQLVPEGTPGASVVAVRRVNELGYYTLTLNQVAREVKLTPPKTLAVIRSLGLQENSEYFKEFNMGSQKYKRYSAKVTVAIKEKLKVTTLDEIWRKFNPSKK